MKRAIQALIHIATILTVCLLGGNTVISVLADSPYLSPNADAGIAYQDGLIFFGESTTAHLKSRGVLSGGNKSEQVWANESGTMLLSPKITEQTIIYPKSGEHLKLAQALQKEAPSHIVLSFGLNGIVGFAKDPQNFLCLYQRLIDTVQHASPHTAILLQTVYPVTAPKDANDWKFSCSPQEINVMIDTLNQALPSLANANTGVKIADTASVLKDEMGQLRKDYATEDGIHLRTEAYHAILRYLRTHAYLTPQSPPITTDQWRSEP